MNPSPKLPSAAAGTIALAVLACSGAAFAQTTLPTASSGQASADDCEITVLLGKKLMGWGQHDPDKSMFLAFYRLSGGEYVAQCPWKSLGVDALPPGQPDLSHMQYFSQPKYDAKGTKATVAYVLQMSRSGPSGAEEPYINETICTLTKRAGQWAVDACKDGQVG